MGEYTAGDIVELSETYIGEEYESTVKSLYYVAEQKRDILQLNISIINGEINKSCPCNREINLYEWSKDKSKSIRKIS